ncbi:MAG: stage III sporulation protein AE [Firmicutes bacterium]|nr:stage III sporulation protein AE [Bacillota bacterium]MCL2255866.1 stage III sporulation protein AE [Bacillota bacterium]
MTTILRKEKWLTMLDGKKALKETRTNVPTKAIGKIRKRRFVIKIVLTLLFVFFLIPFPSTLSIANENAQEDLNQNLREILSQMNTDELDDFLASLTPEQQHVFGARSIADRITRILSGEISLSYSNFFLYLLQVLGVSVFQFLPLVVTILLITISFSVMNAIKGRFASNSVENIVHFAAVSLIILIVLAQMTFLIVSVQGMISSLRQQMNIVFPILLTMMAASGAQSSAAVYQPSVAILASGVTELITLVILPMFILSTVFTVVGSLSPTIKLKRMSGFLRTVSKWLLGTVFFLFIAFLSVQGITASVYDGVSIRTARFAISRYVPIIGGYLSEGLNLVMAGSVLMKNAVGMTAVILLFVSVAPILINIIVFSLSLHLASALSEPLGDERISSLLSELAKNTKMLVAVVLGVAFLYFIFLVLIIATGNLVL